MVNHVRGLKRRTEQSRVGFVTFATVVFDCDNTGVCGLCAVIPAPKKGDAYHYHTFVRSIAELYTKRYS
jgi:hypothetical protein